MRDWWFRVQGQQQIGLHELGLNGRGPHGENGFPGEDGGALRYGPDVPGEVEGAQILQKLLREGVLGAQVGNVLLVEVEVPDVGDHLLQAGGNGEAAAVGDTAEKDIEIADLIGHAGLKIAVAHGQLVEVGEHGVVDVMLHRDGPL